MDVLILNRYFLLLKLYLLLLKLYLLLLKLYLLLLKLLLLLLKLLLLLLLYSIIDTEKCYLLGNHSPLWQVLGCSPIDSCLAFWSDQQLSLC